MELFNTSVGRLVLQTWLLLALTHHKFCPLLHPFSFSDKKTAQENLS